MNDYRGVKGIAGHAQCPIALELLAIQAPNHVVILGRNDSRLAHARSLVDLLLKRLALSLVLS